MKRNGVFKRISQAVGYNLYKRKKTSKLNHKKQALQYKETITEK